MVKIFITEINKIKFLAETSPVYQVYQEDAPSRVDRIDIAGTMDKIADNKFFKRFDLLAPFRRYDFSVFFSCRHSQRSSRIDFTLPIILVIPKLYH